MQTPGNVLRVQLKVVRNSYQDYLNNPFEVEHVHQLRVNLRCLRALLSFLKSTIDERTFNHLTEQLRQAGLLLSPLRDLDVLYAFCSEFAKENPEFSSDYQKLFNYLGILRRREMRKSFNKTNRQLFKEMLEFTDEQLTDSLLTEPKDWPKFIQKRLSNKAEKLEKLMLEVDDMDYETSHETRKKAKKLRYAATHFTDATNQSSNKIRKYAKGIQSNLGRQTDAYVIKNLLTELTDKLSDSATDTAVQTLLWQIHAEITEV